MAIYINSSDFIYEVKYSIIPINPQIPLPHFEIMAGELNELGAFKIGNTLEKGKLLHNNRAS